jgi:hypothetical protein
LTSGEGQRARSNSRSREQECFANILRLKVRIEAENALDRLSFCHQGNNGRHRDSESAQARNAPHLARIRGDPPELHGASVAPWTLEERGTDAPVGITSAS